MVTRWKSGIWAVIVLCALSLSGLAHAADEKPRNVILMIGDGMGINHVRAASYFGHGEEGKLGFERLPLHRVSTFSANKKITDSAAAGTALATGFRVNNGVVSRALPGDGSDLPTLLERCHEKGMRAGIITNTSLLDATPSAFGSHSNHRRGGNVPENLALGLLKNRPEVLFGGGNKVLDRKAFEDVGYAVATSATELEALPDDAPLAVGLFGKSHMAIESAEDRGHPRLRQMVDKGLRLLEKSPDGFFLMIEGGLIDKVSHRRGLEDAVRQTLAFAETADKVLAWAEARGDTLVVITADHETGGLSIVQGKAKGELPEVTWKTTGHTGVKVPLYATGPGAEDLYKTTHHTDVSRTIASLLGFTVPQEMPIEEPVLSEPVESQD